MGDRPLRRRALVSPGDKVVIKTNIVQPSFGAVGHAGRGIITDARIMRHVAERVREIIGFDPPADLKVIDTTLSQANGGPEDPSAKEYGNSFYACRVERTGDATVDADDYCYDLNFDGILDGTSQATLVNLDAVHEADRFTTVVATESLGALTIYLPKFLRTPEQAAQAGKADADEYCDVFIGLPIIKSHATAGFTGAIKLHYGLRNWEDMGDGASKGRGHGGGWYHSGTSGGRDNVQNGHFLDQYLCALHQARSYDFVLMDCLTGNRRGPNQVSNGFVDFIYMNALLASDNLIAIDTVGALFAGYDPASAELIAQGALDGLGTNRPPWIRIIGNDSFYKHREAIRAFYQPQSRYPFENNWGGAYVMNDFQAPTVSMGKRANAGGGIYDFSYSATESGLADLGVARVELIIDGELVAYFNENADGAATFSLDLSGYSSRQHTYQVVVWDNAFNCSVSDVKTFGADVDASGGAVNAADLQTVINKLLGQPVEHDCDINSDGAINATDVQLVVNAALGLW